MMSSEWYQYHDSNFLNGTDVDFIEQVYFQFIHDPQSVPESWREYFSQLEPEKSAASHSANCLRWRETKIQPTASNLPDTAQKAVTAWTDYVQACRHHGYQQADLDPLQIDRPTSVIKTPDELGSTMDIDSLKSLPSWPAHANNLAEACSFYQQIYSQYVGYEFMYLTADEEKNWWIDQLEHHQPKHSAEQIKTIYQQLARAHFFERYLHNRFVGQKRFSLEGADSTLVGMLALLEQAIAEKVNHLFVGMAHRGRLNLLAHFFGKPMGDITAEFEGKAHPSAGAQGDVKYHMGYDSEIEVDGHHMQLHLAYNPSHLESVDPVVQGACRAYLDSGETPKHILPILIHGDSAISGQGVIMELANMSHLRGYQVGGIIHVVINNQVGFTTSDRYDTRSTPYCTDIAKMINAPVIHVNGDEPLAVVRAFQLALAYRQRFAHDVFIDLISYRRHGHNEADEPAATQPIMYQVIRQKKPLQESFAAWCVQQKYLTEQEVVSFTQQLQQQQDAGQVLMDESIKTHAPVWCATDKQLHDREAAYQNKWTMASLQKLALQWLDLPSEMVLQPQVNRLWQDRIKMAKGESAIDWGFAENMAYATMLNQGFSVRISGQDVGRGTFAHRHAWLYHYQTGERMLPLAQVAQHGANIDVYDSLLSEEAVLGFEYGYSLIQQRGLVVWEAQFGDFVNGAQVIIDQYLSSAEAKWGQQSHLVMLLPHGFEGMGPEHSSARLERFLQLAAENNLSICIPSTPAQCFHMLRRQCYLSSRRPLVVMSPKSLLRHRQAVSQWDLLANGTFLEVIDDGNQPHDQAEVVVLCSGKVYYDLLAQREALQQEHQIALVRIEQLYPWPAKTLCQLLKCYRHAKVVRWCQEEPKNQGAWGFLQELLPDCLAKHQRLSVVTRPASASPAVGSAKIHAKQQQQLIEAALAGASKD